MGFIFIEFISSKGTNIPNRTVYTQFTQKDMFGKGLHCLALIQQCLDARADNNLDLFNVLGQLWKVVRCPNI